MNSKQNDSIVVERFPFTPRLEPQASTNKQKWIILLIALAMIGGAATALHQIRTHQKLGFPGIKTSPIAGSQRVKLYLPEQVLDYDSEIVPTDAGVLKGLPQDTSFLQRRYFSPSGSLALNIVLMGSDRTSMHKPEFCLPGSGWIVNQEESGDDTLPIKLPHAYDLPVTKLMTTREIVADGRQTILRGIYVYWFVAHDDLAGTRPQMLWHTAAHLLRTGELERWAFIGCLAPCRPGEEKVTCERLKKFLAASVPEFQLTAGVTQESPKTASR